MMSDPSDSPSRGSHHCAYYSHSYPEPCDVLFFPSKRQLSAARQCCNWPSCSRLLHAERNPTLLCWHWERLCALSSGLAHVCSMCVSVCVCVRACRCVGVWVCHVGTSMWQ
eukprot:11162883-Lingulodinium_polyedra.AAC.2